MKTLKICLLFLCLLPFQAVGLPQIQGANFFMETEIWKDVVGFEKTHQVSNQGRVRSKDWLQKHSSSGKLFKKKGKFMTIREGTAWNGYTPVAITVNGKQVPFLLHRIVANAFIPNPENKPFVNHKNGIKTDNRPENLEWVTRSENAKHAFRIGLQSNKGDKHPKHKLTNSEVISIRLRYSLGESSWKIFKSFNGAQSYTNIKDIIAKRTWAHL
jgi:hypothetical protein